MNPWSRAEPGEESSERELFARRARALEPAVVPSLAAVLDEAKTRREAQAAVSARGRSFVAMALAAACMIAALTRLPQPETRSGGAQSARHDTIAADIDASTTSSFPSASVSASFSASLSASTEEPSAGDTCTPPEDTRLALEEEQACFAPAQLYTPATLGGSQAPRPCGPNESCPPPAHSQ